MMNINVQFDENILASAIVNQVVQAIKDLFHKVFPRLRSEDLDDSHRFYTGSIPSDTPNLTTSASVPLAQPFIDLSKDENARCNGNVRPSAYLIKDNKKPISIPKDEGYCFSFLTVPEAFYFFDKTKNELVPYYVLETNKA